MKIVIFLDTILSEWKIILIIKFYLNKNCLTDRYYVLVHEKLFDRCTNASMSLNEEIISFKMNSMIKYDDNYN